MKEKNLPQGTVHKIAREEAANQYKRKFARLKTSIKRKLATQLNKNANKVHQINKITITMQINVRIKEISIM